MSALLNVYRLLVEHTTGIIIGINVLLTQYNKNHIESPIRDFLQSPHCTANCL